MSRKLAGVQNNCKICHVIEVSIVLTKDNFSERWNIKEKRNVKDCAASQKLVNEEKQNSHSLLSCINLI